MDRLYDLQEGPRSDQWCVVNRRTGEVVATEPSVDGLFVDLDNPHVVEALSERYALDAVALQNCAKAVEAGLPARTFVPNWLFPAAGDA